MSNQLLLYYYCEFISSPHTAHIRFGLDVWYAQDTSFTPGHYSLVQAARIAAGGFGILSGSGRLECGMHLCRITYKATFLQGNKTDISQLNTIFQVCGTPTETNWPDHNTLPLCTRGLEWDSSPPIPFDEIFTAALQDCISLLHSMLMLDPNKRFTASQCLNHPYFSNDPPPTPKSKLILSSD